MTVIYQVFSKEHQRAERACPSFRFRLPHFLVCRKSLECSGDYSLPFSLCTFFWFCVFFFYQSPFSCANRIVWYEFTKYKEFDPKQSPLNVQINSSSWNFVVIIIRLLCLRIMTYLTALLRGPFSLSSSGVTSNYPSLTVKTGIISLISKLDSHTREFLQMVETAFIKNILHVFCMNNFLKILKWF